MLAASSCSSQATRSPAPPLTSKVEPIAIDSLDYSVKPLDFAKASEEAGYHVVTFAGRPVKSAYIARPMQDSVGATVLLEYQVDATRVALSERPAASHPPLSAFASTRHLPLMSVEDFDVLEVPAGADQIDQALWVVRGDLVSVGFRPLATGQLVDVLVRDVY